jgi:hypothetical protein
MIPLQHNEDMQAAQDAVKNTAHHAATVAIGEMLRQKATAEAEGGQRVLEAICKAWGGKP